MPVDGQTVRDAALAPLGVHPASLAPGPDRRRPQGARRQPRPGLPAPQLRGAPEEGERGRLLRAARLARAPEPLRQHAEPALPQIPARRPARQRARPPLFRGEPSHPALRRVPAGLHHPHGREPPLLPQRRHLPGGSQLAAAGRGRGPRAPPGCAAHADGGRGPGARLHVRPRGAHEFRFREAAALAHVRPCPRPRPRRRPYGHAASLRRTPGTRRRGWASRAGSASTTTAMRGAACSPAWPRSTASRATSPSRPATGAACARPSFLELFYSSPAYRANADLDLVRSDTLDATVLFRRREPARLPHRLSHVAAGRDRARDRRASRPWARRRPSSATSSASMRAASTSRPRAPSRGTARSGSSTPSSTRRTSQTGRRLAGIPTQLGPALRDLPGRQIRHALAEPHPARVTPAGAGDPRPDLDGYALFDLAARIHNFHRALELSAVLHDLFGQDYFDPAPLAACPATIRGPASPSSSRRSTGSRDGARKASRLAAAMWPRLSRGRARLPAVHAPPRAPSPCRSSRTCRSPCS